MTDVFHSKINLIKLTLLSYSIAFLTGAMIVLPFVLKGSAAKYFGADLEHVGYAFSFFMFGVVIFQFLNGYLIKLISIRAEVFVMAITYIIVAIGLLFIHKLYMVIPLFLLLGFGAGISATLPNYILVQSYHGENRTSKLNFLDFSFSLGSLIYPMISAFMIHKGFSWQSVYLSLIIIFIEIIILAGFTTLPQIHIPLKKSAVAFVSSWNKNIVLVGVAVVFYFMSYSGYRYWLSEYLVKDLHMSLYAANFGLSLFWIWYAVGCFLAGFLVKMFSTSKYIIVSTIISTLTYIFIYNSVNVEMMYVGISILGLATSTVYASSISYATHLSPNPNPRIVSYIIVSGGMGSYFSEIYSSWVCGHLGLRAVTLTSAVLMFAAAMIYIYISSDKNNLYKISSNNV